MKSTLILVLLSCGVIMTAAYPYAYPYPYPYPQQSASSSAQGLGSALTTNCQTREVAPGKYAVVCEDLGRSNPEALTLRSEHVLWINQATGQSQDIDVLVPNYRIDELIKAGFKGDSAGGTRVNILLKKPQQTYNAEVGQSEASKSPPSVSVLYEPVQKVLVHYPNDKPYQPSSGPITPPA